MDEWGYEIDLEFDLFTAQRGGAGQGRNLIEGTGDLFCRFDKRRALQRPLTRLPHNPAAFSISPASVQWRATNSGRLSAISVNWLSMASAIRACNARLGSAQQRPIRRVLHESVLEQIGSI
jgi:hypothetical protein